MILIHTPKYTVGVFDCNTRGWFEHNELGDECGGGLWFNNLELYDYDGVYMLPSEVLESLEANGYNVQQMREDLQA